IHPDEGIRDIVYERIDRKFERFIKRSISGEDITGRIRLNIHIPPLPSRVEDLRKYSIGRSHIGLAALSTAASFSRCNSNFTRDYGEHIKKSWLVAHKSYGVADQIKAKYNYAKVYIYNGRFAISRPFSDHMEDASSIIFYEYGSKKNMYELYEDRIHSVAYQAQLINAHTPNLQCGSKFFQDKTDRWADWVDTDFYQAISIQTPHFIPDGLLVKPFITLFTTSPDELFAINDSSGFGPFRNQFELALCAAKACQTHGKALVLKLHPYLRFKHKSWKEEWKFQALIDHGAVILFPESNVDAHALMSHSKGVITAGSSMSFDAAFLEIPNIVAGDALSDKIGCSSALKSVADLEKFIAGPTLIEGAKNAAIRYASYMGQFGIAMDSLELTDNEDAKIDGQFVSPSLVATKFLKRCWRRILGG
ncbi:MAG: hypothetical protein O3A57_12095, partial [Bacteroidetes bacterium]|nr:hypothetical protein [Bacteroidota bacterium]